jgi:hypothetical protein
MKSIKKIIELAHD